MTFTEALRTCLLKQYATFSGRASRREFWFFYLFYSVVLTGLGSLVAFSLMRITDDVGFGIDSDDLGEVMTAVFSDGLGDPAMMTTFYGVLIVFILVSVALLLPYLSASVRRLHDLNQSGGWAILLFMPFFSIAMLFAFAFRGSVGENRYGPDPLGDFHASSPDAAPLILAKQPIKNTVPARTLSNDELTLANVVKMCFTDKFCSFKGRASRKEFWLFWFFYLILNLVVFLISTYMAIILYPTISAVAHNHQDYETIVFVTRKITIIISINMLIFWCFLLPYLGVAVRRLHDLNKSGGWSALLIIPIPFIAVPLLIYFMFRGTVGANSFGPDPLDPPAEAAPIVIGA